MPPPPLAAAGGITLLCLSVRASVPDVVSVISMVRTDQFYQTFVSNASCNKDDRLGFWGQKIKGQGLSMTKYAKNTTCRQRLAELNAGCQVLTVNKT